MAIAGFRSLLGWWAGGGGSTPFGSVETPTVSYPPIASSDRFRLYAIPETTFATTPVLTAVVRNIPLTSMKGGTQIERRASVQYRRNNQRGDSVTLRQHATNHIDFELRPDAYDDLLAAVIGSRIFQPIGLVRITDAHVDATLKTFVVVSDIDWVRLGVRPGMWVQTAGFHYSNNNGVHLIASVTSTTLTVYNTSLVSESPSTTESHMLTVGFRIGHARSGSTKRTFFLEAQYEDVELFEQYLGMQPSAVTLDMRPRSLIAGTMDFVGVRTNNATVGVLDAAFLCPARQKTVFDTSNSILSVWEAGAPFSVPVTSLSVHMDNGASALSRISNLEPYGIQFSAITIRGSLQVYFASIGLKQKFLMHEQTSLHVHLQGAEGDRWILSFPHVTLLTGDNSIEGSDRDVFVSCEWEATVDPVLGFTASMDFFSGGTFTYLPFSSGVPLAEYFRMRDQTGIFWRFWIDTAGQLTRSLDSDGFVLLDETPVNLTTGVVPFWHQVTDEIAGTWYLYPDVTGELLMAASPPAIGTGLVVGLGQQVRGIDHALYRLGVGSDQSMLTQTMNITWLNVPRVWYMYLNATLTPVIDVLPPTYIPGFTGEVFVSGIPPSFYQIQDQIGGITRYLTVSTAGVLTVSSTLPSGTGYNAGIGLDIVTTGEIHYRIVVVSGVIVYQRIGSICGVQT